MVANRARLELATGIMLRLDRISKIFPQGEPLSEVSWEAKPGERVGLVGANGTGKTTQFKIIMGEVEASSGEVFKPKDARIAYLTQEFEIDPNNTVKDELLTAFTECHKVKSALNAVHHQLQNAEGLSPEDLDKLIRRMDRLQSEFEHIGGYALERKVDKLLPEIGFSIEDGDRLVSSYSGGWQMRIGFGKVMLRQPDLLLLDEPTNHIDLETIEWLEKYLLSLPVPMVIVSHDRRFLDRLCTKIVEIESGEATTYPGNYSAYVTAKEETRAQQQAAFERQQAEIERQQVFIERFRASATRSTQAKSREKQLEKWDLIDEPDAEARGLMFKFVDAPRSGKEVATVSKLFHAYGDNIVFMEADLKIMRGDRIALIGPNGCGKSTLLRLLTGKEQPEDGVVQLGEHNIFPAYFEQNQAEALDKEKTVLDTIGDVVPQWKDHEVRGLLGRFLFSGDTVGKKVKQLSGGEKARLALAKMLTGAANFLLLDEPTNHLDIPAKETVEAALNSFDGTIVVVSHDRYFLSQVANKIVEIKDGMLKVYSGGYDYYEKKLVEEKDRELQGKLDREEEARREAKRQKRMEKEKAKKLEKKQEKQAAKEARLQASD